MPTSDQQTDVDVLVFDIQDIGARFYTYISTMGGAMEEAAKAKVKFFVLDRPNPITGTHVEGPVADKDLLSFVGYFPMPLPVSQPNMAASASFHSAPVVKPCPAFGSIDFNNCETARAVAAE